MKKLYMLVALIMSLTGAQVSFAADAHAQKNQSANDQPFKSNEMNFVVDKNKNGIDDENEDRDNDEKDDDEDDHE